MNPQQLIRIGHIKFYKISKCLILELIDIFSINAIFQNFQVLHMYTNAILVTFTGKREKNKKLKVKYCYETYDIVGPLSIELFMKCDSLLTLIS